MVIQLFFCVLTIQGETMAKKINLCKAEHLHESVVENVKEMMPEIGQIYKVSELFKVFGDSTRAVILSALSKSEMCVCDICKIANMNKSAISHQLKVLRDNDLVKFRRDGKAVFYSLKDEHVIQILNLAFEHINE